MSFLNNMVGQLAGAAGQQGQGQGQGPAHQGPPSGRKLI